MECVKISVAGIEETANKDKIVKQLLHETFDAAPSLESTRVST